MTPGDFSWSVLLWSVLVFHICYRWICNSHKVPLSMALLCGISFQMGGCYWILIIVSRFFSCYLVWGGLFIADLGYLHLIRTSCRWCNSSVCSWGVEHTALALCVRVLTTLYLNAMLWWLSHCKYKSVCVGFLYTPVDEGSICLWCYYSELGGWILWVDVLQELFFV